MNQKNLPIYLALALAAVMGGCSEVSEWRTMRGAQAAMLPWLSLLDQAQYDQAWQEAAPQFQARSSSAAWVIEVGTSRPAGKVLSRDVVTRKFFRRLGAGPEGRYVNLTFQVFLEDGTTFGELMTVIDSQGTWRAYGYKVVGVHKRAP